MTMNKPCFLTRNPTLITLGIIIFLISSSIYQSPKHPYTKALTSLIKKIDLDNKFKKIELKGEVPSIFERKSGCVFFYKMSKPIT